jgi:hypothetical protein
MLLARLFASLPLVCPNGGADMRIIAFVTETAPVQRILLALGEPVEPPRISPARGPPAWDDPPADLGPDWEALAQRFGMTHGAVRKAAADLRRRFGALLREEVRGVVSSDEQVDDELRYLLGLLSAA